MNKHSKILITVTLLISVVFTSCKKNSDGPTPSDKYLVSYKKVKTISNLEVDAALNYLSVLYPNAKTIANKAVSGVTVYKITYNTTFQSQPIIASGLVCVPTGLQKYPMISYQNGTITLHSDAPTVAADTSEMGKLYTFLETVSSTGFVIAIPDYIGFGSTENTFHPYLDKASTIPCVVDMIRAAKELMNSHNLNVQLSNDLYITGYSMGGWATLQLQKAIETDYSGEFNLKASACGAGPYDLTYINNYVLGQTQYPMPYFLGYMLNSYTQLGEITNNLSDIINEPYASKIPGLYDGNYSGDQINSQLTTSVDSLFTSAYRNGYQSAAEFSSVRQTLSDNSIGAWNISTPLLLLHGEADTFVPVQVSENLYNDFLNLGVSSNMVHLVTFPGINHTEGIIPSEIDAINWFIQIKDGGK
ncbi:MAG: prolyl oligopeptidase family serine peptidase [Bacteroidales bacterium]|nr:prolyl oligopeptidase family serine peptidase [Bacteroidales bacterium]